jgi:hypothetical protein
MFLKAFELIEANKNFSKKVTESEISTIFEDNLITFKSSLKLVKFFLKLLLKTLQNHLIIE